MFKFLGYGAVIEYQDNNFICFWSSKYPKAILDQYHQFVTEINSGDRTFARIDDDEGGFIEVSFTYEMILIGSSDTHCGMLLTDARLLSLVAVLGQWYTYALTLP